MRDVTREALSEECPGWDVDSGVQQPQPCRSPGSPRKASCGARYPAGIRGTSLPCGNP